MWQDYVFLGGSIVIMLSLVPTLRDEEATIPLSTSLPSVMVLLAQTVAFSTIGLTASAAGTGMGFVLWSLIAKYKSPWRDRPDHHDGVLDSVARFANWPSRVARLAGSNRL